MTLPSQCCNNVPHVGGHDEPVFEEVKVTLDVGVRH